MVKGAENELNHLEKSREILIRCRSQSCARQRRCFAFCLSPGSVPCQVKTWFSDVFRSLHYFEKQ